MTIWKFPLDITDFSTLWMPIGAKPLCVQTQRGVPCLWAFVPNPRAGKEDRTFRIIGTGHEFNPSEVGDYIGTFQVHDGQLVFHVFHTVAGGAPAGGGAEGVSRE